MNPIDLSDKIKSLRSKRAWTQEQLAQIAGVNVRTIQRLEATGSHSPETLQALAAAFDVDITALTEQIQSAADLQTSPVTIKSHRLTANQWAFAGAVIMLPAVYFVASNILKYYFGLPWLAAPLETLRNYPLGWQWFRALSPFVFLGGLAIAVLLNLWAMTEIRFGDDTKRFSFLFIPTLANLAVVSIGGMTSAIMLVYGIVENAGHR